MDSSQNAYEVVIDTQPSAAHSHVAVRDRARRVKPEIGRLWPRARIDCSDDSRGNRPLVRGTRLIVARGLARSRPTSYKPPKTRVVILGFDLALFASNKRNFQRLRNPHNFRIDEALGTKHSD